MKRLFARKSNIYLLAAIIAIAAVGIWCLALGGGTDGGKLSSTALAEGQVPLSAGPGDADSAVGSANDKGSGAAGSADPYAGTAGGTNTGTDSGEAGAGSGDAAANDPYAASNPYQPGSTAASGSAATDNGASGTTTPAAQTVTLSITCYTILNNLGDLTPGKEGLVPPGGTIMGTRAVTFTEGETVFDVLTREVRNSGIHMEYSNSPLYQSAYIEGIGNLYEFDCGNLSGWMYRVNGWYPNYGCSRYTLSDGDVIEWIYTCDLGNDIGGGGVTQG